MMSFGISYFLCYFMALAYPTYASFRAINTVTKEDDTQWLTYWVCFSFLTTAEIIIQSFFAWIPLYYEAKLLFVIWLQAPHFKGAQLIFEKFIKPFMMQYASKIDPVFATAGRVIDSPQMKNVLELIEKHGPEYVEKALSSAADQAGKMASKGSNTPPASPPGHHHHHASVPTAPKYPNVPPSYARATGF